MSCEAGSYRTLRWNRACRSRLSCFEYASTALALGGKARLVTWWILRPTALNAGQVGLQASPQPLDLVGLRPTQKPEPQECESIRHFARQHPALLRRNAALPVVPGRAFANSRDRQRFPNPCLCSSQERIRIHRPIRQVSSLGQMCRIRREQHFHGKTALHQFVECTRKWRGLGSVRGPRDQHY